MPHRYIHRVELRTYCHPTEDLDNVAACMLYIRSPESAIEGGERVVEYLRSIDISDVEGHYGNTIKILSDTVKDKNVIDAMFRHITDVNGLWFVDSVVEERMDDECTMHLRFDKDNIMRAILSSRGGDADYGGFKIVDGENIVKAEIKVAAYPARTEIAVKVMKEYLMGFLPDED